MKATIEFNLDIPEEAERFQIFTHAIDLYMALWEIDGRLRNEVKYQNNKEAEQVREEIDICLKEHNLHLQMLR